MNFALFLHFACAMASSAFFFDDFSCAVTVRTNAAVDNTAKRRILHDFLLTVP